MPGMEPARLIPVSGISSDTEAEQRATSALLAVISIVRPFSKSLLSPYGASKAGAAKVQAFIEPSFKSNGKTVRPDGMLTVTYGSNKPWTALVEVKTGSSKLSPDQINSYIEVARSDGYDCVLTISNEIAPSPGVHPTCGLNVKSNSRVLVHHVSWTKILSEAVVEKTHRGVEDVEQAWILGELIRYLNHPNSGAMSFDDMGTNWVAVRDGARNGTLNKRDDGLEDIAQRWDQLLSYASLKLGADLGRDVLELVPKAQQRDPRLRTKEFVDSLCNGGTLAGSLRIPDTIGDIELVADLKARQNIVSVTFDAPSDKGAKGRVGWLIRQLDDAPGGLVIESYAKNAKNGIAASLGAVRDDPMLLLGPDKKEPAKFKLVARTELGANRRAGKKPGFVQSMVASIESFYGDILQDLVEYVPKAPKLKPTPELSRMPERELQSVPLVAEPRAVRPAIPMGSGGNWGVNR